MSLDGLVSMVNGHGGESDLGGTENEPGEAGSGVGSRAIPAPVTSIPKLPSTVRVAHLVKPPQNVVRTHYNLHRVPNYIRIADVVRAQQEREGLVRETGPGEGSQTLAGGEAHSPGEDEPTSPGGSPTLHVLRQVTVHMTLRMRPVLMRYGSNMHVPAYTKNPWNVLLLQHVCFGKSHHASTSIYCIIT